MRSSRFSINCFAINCPLFEKYNQNHFAESECTGKNSTELLLPMRKMKFIENSYRQAHFTFFALIILLTSRKGAVALPVLNQVLPVNNQGESSVFQRSSKESSQYVRRSISQDTSEVVSTEEPTLAAAVEVVNLERGFKWSNESQHSRAPVAVTGFKNQHRWIICERDDKFMLGIMPQSDNDVYRFAINHRSRVHLDSELRPCEINLTNSENEMRYFRFVYNSGGVKGRDLIQHVSSEEYVTFSDCGTRKCLSFTNSSEFAISWSLELIEYLQKR